MENKKINVEVKDSTKELVIREGKAADLPGLRKAVAVSGDLTVPRIHLSNPMADFEVVIEGSLNTVLNHSFLEVNRENGSILLFENCGLDAGNEYFGKLSFTKELLDFKINSGKSYTTLELANFIKMNRSYFETKDKAMQLVSELRNFKAKVDKEVESSEDGRGNKRMVLGQAVESNIPENFNILLSVFKGLEKIAFEVEISIDPGDLSCSLISPELNDYTNIIMNEAIDAELEKIAELFPSLRVFEV